MPKEENFRKPIWERCRTPVTIISRRKRGGFNLSKTKKEKEDGRERTLETSSQGGLTYPSTI